MIGDNSHDRTRIGDGTVKTASAMPPADASPRSAGDAVIQAAAQGAAPIGAGDPTRMTLRLKPPIGQAVLSVLLRAITQRRRWASWAIDRALLPIVLRPITPAAELGLDGD